MSAARQVLGIFVSILLTAAGMAIVPSSASAAERPAIQSEAIEQSPETNEAEVQRADNSVGEGNQVGEDSDAAPRHVGSKAERAPADDQRPENDARASQRPAATSANAKITTAKVTSTSPGGLTLHVEGSGYRAEMPGIYVGLAERDSFDAADASRYRGTEWVLHGPPIPGTQPMRADGTFTVNVTLDADEVKTLDPSKEYSVYTFKAHGQAATDPSQTVELPIPLPLDKLNPGAVHPTKPHKPGASAKPKSGKSTTTGKTSKAARQSRTPGYLTWGVSSKFRSYVTGPIAQGSIAVGNGARVSGAAFRFDQTSTTSKTGQAKGRTSYRGSLAFSGHRGALSLSLAAPHVTVTSSARATLSMNVNGSRQIIANLDLSRAARSKTAGAVSFRGAPATLTSAGATAFSGFYSAGESMEPVTFVVGSAATKGAGATGTHTVSQAAAKKSWTPPTTPPATSGLKLSFDDDEVEPGTKFTASGDGFQPDEKIRVVVYSTPVVLNEDVTADADGKATYTGLLPENLESGKHTLTFQASTHLGASFSVKKSSEDAGKCTIDDASFNWGVKESFRSYLTSSMANGGWDTTGNASYKTPVFTFGKGDGALDPKAMKGKVTFDGAIEFTGHEGALDVTLANPVLKMAGKDTAYLLFDATHGSMEDAMAGDASTTTEKAIPIVELDLSGDGLDTEKGVTKGTDIAATLTPQGAEVFSNYKTGDDFDPIDFTISQKAECAEPAAADASKAETAAVEKDSGGTPWTILVIAGLVIVAAVGSLAYVLGRRSGAEE